MVTDKPFNKDERVLLKSQRWRFSDSLIDLHESIIIGGVLTLVKSAKKLWKTCEVIS